MLPTFRLLAILVVVGVASSYDECLRACPFIYAPVCDAEGNFYDNACMMQADACIGDRKVVPAMCTMEYKPVCGSDGRTYANECQLNARGCLGVMKMSDGECPSRSGRRSLGECLTICTMEYNPVCGTNGKMYSNFCQLQVVSCLSNGEIGMPACPYNYNPVCGSDGITYGNLCSLESQSCFNVTYVSDGECEEASKAADDEDEPECNTACTYEYNPVCGSDGVKYANPCVLGVASCQSNGAISMPMCTLEYQPVCGSDGQTYGNQCMLDAQKCLNVTKVSEGECEAAALMSGGEKQEKCDTTCTYEYNPVCGSDGVKYANPCVLKVASCQSGGAISMPICTMEYRPVCGSDGLMYGNRCMLNAQRCMGVERADWSKCGTVQKKRKLVDLLRAFANQ